jgi:hypothetical protein
MGPSGAAGCRLTDAEVAVAAARAGAAVVREAYGSAPQQIGGSRLDVTTEADLASERAVLSMLAAHRADDAREGEETGLSGHAAARRRWLVDPLCGTANFAATTPLMSVNVALTQAGAVIAAASVDPITAEVFWTDGEGAWLRTNGHDSVLTPSASSRLVETNCDGPLSVPFVGRATSRRPGAPNPLGSSRGVHHPRRCLGRGRTSRGLHHRWQSRRLCPLQFRDRSVPRRGLHRYRSRWRAAPRRSRPDRGS